MATRLLATACVLALAVFTAAAPARVRNVTDPDAPRSLPADGRVDVRWDDPARFTELRYSGNRYESRQGDWVAQLATHLRKCAADRLPAGERLDIEITDIRRAGRYEPFHHANPDVRVVRDIYPPAIDLSFKVLSADGTVVSEGARKLRDAAFMDRGNAVGASDPLRYEKALIDDWLRREFRDGVASTR